MPIIQLLAASLALAGDTVHEVALRGGVNEIVRADRMITGTQHQGASPTFDVAWSPRGPRLAHGLEVSFTPGQMSSGPPFDWSVDGEEHQTGNDAAALADLQYALGRRIQAGKWTIHLGGTVASHFENITTNYGFLGMETYLGVFELGPWLDLRRELGKRQTLELQAWAPIASWVARNPYPAHNGQHIYNTRDNQPLRIIPRFIADGSPQTWNHYQAIHVRVGYAFDLNDTFAVVVRGRADGLHLSVPHPLVEWQLGMNLGIRGSF